MKFILIASALFMSLTVSLFAQQSQTLSLKQAVDLALEKNVTVIQSQNSVEAAQSRVVAAYGNYLPTLSASGSWNRTQNDQAGVYTTNSFGGTATSVRSGTLFLTWAKSRQLDDEVRPRDALGVRVAMLGGRRVRYHHGRAEAPDLMAASPFSRALGR